MINESIAPPPTGATSEEVKDNIDIKASEGEYILPANVVRYLGLDKIEKMVQKAQTELAQLSQQGRIGGDKGGDDLPFSPEELLAVEASAPSEAAPRMAEGGLVTPDTGMSQTQGFTGVKSFTDGSGKTIFVPYMAGNPMFAIPQGFTEVSADAATPSAPTSFDLQGRGEEGGKGNRGEIGPEEFHATRMSRSPKEWEVDDFGKLAANRSGVGYGTIERGISKVMPMGGLALEARNRYLDKAIPETINEMLKTGVDSQGNSISEEQRTQLKESLKSFTDTPMSVTKGGGLGGSIKDALSDLFGLKTEAAKLPVKEETATETVSEEPSEKSSVGGGDDKDRSLAPSTSPRPKANPNYRKGGLVARVKY